MVFSTKAEVKKLEARMDILDTQMANMELKSKGLKRDLSRVFGRVSRDFVVHSEKLDPDTEDK